MGGGKLGGDKPWHFVDHICQNIHQWRTRIVQ